MIIRTAVALGGLLILTGCAGSPVGDAIAGPEKLAQQDDAYCREIGAVGPSYTNCRLSMTQRRDDKHTRALEAFRSAPAVRCVTVGPPEARTTTCN